MSNNWKCPKCDCRDYDTDTIATTGSGLSKIFDMKNRKFTAVTCDNCSYTEFYRG
ncbi:MAG: GTP-binding protein [Alteromonadaceae bacterium]|nr:GTP-binding protein [Alteromonadaceae bacterium]